MANLPEFYVKEVLKNTTYLANTSLAKTKMEVGDYGIIKKGIFQFKGKIKNKKNFKVKLDVEKQTSLPIDSQSTGVGKQKADSKVVGENLFEVGLNINFKKRQSYFLNVTEGTRSEILNNVDEVAAELIRLFLLGDWPEDYVFVDEVVNGKYTTILISAENNNKVKLTGKLNKKVFSFLDLGGNYSYTNEKSLSTKITAKKNYSHLFHGIKLQRNLLQKFLGYDPTVSRVDAFASFDISPARKLKSGKKLKASSCFPRVKE